MDAQHIGDRLHRAVKMAMDSGEAASLAEAEHLFRGYRLAVSVGADVRHSPTLQAALLTVVNTARRCFLGGIEVAGNLNVALLVPWSGCRTLGEAVVALQGKIVTDISPATPQVVIGDERGHVGEDGFVVRTTFDGWAGGVVPAGDATRLSERQECTPAGVLAGALAVSEAFQHVRGNVMAGRRAVGLSLWRPDVGAEWLTGRDTGPSLASLPSRLWLVGLGHLGQAYLWTLGFLPYATPDEVELVLQDFDTLVPANDSTSPLTMPTMLGEQKTRAMARWCEARGFRTAIHERRFAADFQVSGAEPQVALCGVDNALARAALEDVGFRRVIEAGLGRGPREYLAFQMHTFPAARTARQRWGIVDFDPGVSSLVEQPAYQSLADDGLDACGLTTLAGRAVGAAFVGTAVSTFVIAETLRMALGAQRYQVIDGSLRTLDGRQIVLLDDDRDPFNPGVTRAAD